MIIKNYQLAFLLILTLNLIPQKASATLITYEGRQTITSFGQSFNWIEEVETSGSSGILIFEAAGDFNTSGTENSSIYLDDLFLGENYGLHNADITMLSSPDGHYWKKSFTLTSTLMSMLTVDNIINITINNSALVDPIWPTGFVSWTLTYNTVESIPEPSSIALLGLGIVALRFARRKRAKL